MTQNASSEPQLAFIISRCFSRDTKELIESELPYYYMYSVDTRGVQRIEIRGPFDAIIPRIQEAIKRGRVSHKDYVHIRYDSAGRYTQLPIGWFLSAFPTPKHPLLSPPQDETDKDEDAKLAVVTVH